MGNQFNKEVKLVSKQHNDTPDAFLDCNLKRFITPFREFYSVLLTATIKLVLKAFGTYFIIR